MGRTAVGFWCGLFDELSCLGFGYAIECIEQASRQFAGDLAECDTGRLGILRAAASGDGLSEFLWRFGDHVDHTVESGIPTTSAMRRLRLSRLAEASV